MPTSTRPPDTSNAQDGIKSASTPTTQATVDRPEVVVKLPLDLHHVLGFILAFRLLNALTLNTFFQPDEYFQALEPAWRMAFGDKSGAWITWEWKHHLRSAIHPVLFTLCYQAAQAAAVLFNVGPERVSELYLAAPKVLQAVCAAFSDHFTWRLACYIYGANSPAAFATLLLTLASPWQWFCSTRTFSNSLETTLTIAALYNWPWHWSLPPDMTGDRQSKIDANGLRIRDPVEPCSAPTDEVSRIRRALLCAAVATILRPTNILIWASLTLLTFRQGWASITLHRTEGTIFVKEAVTCGTVVILCSVLVDRIFYQTWVFPPLNFLHFNVIQSLSAFYGHNDWHYYLSQGHPLLLTTVLPFTVVGVYRIVFSRVPTPLASLPGSRALRSLSWVVLLVPAAFSNIAHKEVRFIYPLLPALHVISALPLASFFGRLRATRPDSSQLGKKLLLAALLAVNVFISYYTSRVHNAGLINVTSYLRKEFQTAYLPAATPSNMSVGFLMPCHSTPWRSHLQFPPSSDHTGIHGWALTCEPPVNLTSRAKASYLDEADQFYHDPSRWLKKHMSRHPPARKDGTKPPTGSLAGGSAGIFAADHHSSKYLWTNVNSEIVDQAREADFWSDAAYRGRRPWPDYLVFFAQLEPTLQANLRHSAYVECQRLFNSVWHDDWRRHGDVVIWCLAPDRAAHTPIQGTKRMELEEALHDPNAAAHGQTARRDGVADSRAPKATRVVETPFWKIRD